MRIPYQYRPSPGFIILALSWIFVALFFLWGYSEPDLDVAWRVRHRLRGVESVNVTPGEAEAIRRVTEKHPELRLEVTPEGKAYRPARTEESGQETKESAQP